MPKVEPKSEVPKVVRNPFVLNWKNIILGLLVGTTVISSGIAAFYYLQLRGTSQPPELKPPAASPSATPKPEQPTVIPDETADWKTFTDQTRESDPAFDPTRTIKFSFKYPLDFRILDDEGGPFVSNDPSQKSGYDILKKSGSISADAGLAGEEPPDSPSNFTLGGKAALRGLRTYSHNKFVTVVYHVSSVTTREGVKVPFSFRCNYVPKQGVGTEKTCDLMASTFKFLSSTSSE